MVPVMVNVHWLSTRSQSCNVWHKACIICKGRITTRQAFWWWQGGRTGGPLPPNIRNNKKKRIINIHISCTIKACVSYSWWCPGTFAPSMAHLTVSLIFCSSRSSLWGESRTLEESHVSSYSPSRVWVGEKVVTGRKGRELRFPQRGRGLWFAHQANA